MNHQGVPRPDTRRVPRRQLFGLGVAAGGTVLFAPSTLTSAFAHGVTRTDSNVRPRPGDLGADVPVAWFSYVRDLVRTTDGFSPPVAARVYGYAGVALYEALVKGMPEYRSIAPPSSTG